MNREVVSNPHFREVSAPRKTIELTYFKSTGKFYSTGFVEVSPVVDYYHFLKWLRGQQEAGNLPGVHSGKEFFIYFEFNGVPRLLHPLQDS